MDVRGGLGEKRWVHTTLRIALSLGLLCSIYLVFTQAVAAWFFRQGTPEGVRKAIQWDPRNPDYYASLARLVQLGLADGDVGVALHLYEKATQLSPHNADYWAELGAAYEWAGRLDDAQRALERAKLLFPNSPDINWRLGNFYLRTGKTEQAFQNFQKAMLGDPNMRRGAFDLAWHATDDGKLILAAMIPPRQDILFQYLDYLAETRRMEEANQVWERLLGLGARFEPKEAFPYLDALIARRQIDQLMAVWEKVLEKSAGEFRSRAADHNLITNGDFRSELLNGGLDWRVIPTEGVVVSVDGSGSRDGSHSLRIQFDGKNNIDYSHIFQYVPVKPNAKYRFSGYMRAQAITTDSGPRVQLVDAYDPGKMSLETDNLVSSVDWASQQLQFRTGPETRLLVLRVARPPSRKFDNQIAGTVWVGHLTLDAVE